jgi:hypothetical protein
MSNGPLPLLVHASAPAAVRAVAGTISRAGPGQLAARWRLEADLTALRIPDSGPVCFAVGLWEHTCFELFARTPGSSPYFEFNVSPSRSWAAFAFSDYRVGRIALADLAPPCISVSAAAGVLTVAGRITLPPALAGTAPPALELALAAVIEDATGTLSYWALAHPGPRPDFHHPDGFVARLDRPASGPMQRP